jgi:hypothetical protein
MSEVVIHREEEEYYAEFVVVELTDDPGEFRKTRDKILIFDDGERSMAIAERVAQLLRDEFS